MTNKPDGPSPRTTQTTTATLPALSSDPAAKWTAHRWGTVIAAAVYAEMRQTYPIELSETDPVLRRAVGRAIQREVTKALEHVTASVQPSGL